MVTTHEDPRTIKPPDPVFVEHRLPLRRIVVALSTIVLGVVCLDLVGWIAHIPVLTSFIPRYTTMKPNTAFCLGLLAAALIVRPAALQARDRRREVAAACVAGLSLILSGATLLEYLTGTNPGLDALILPVGAGRLGEPVVRMSPGTAMCLTLIGLSIVLIDRAARLCSGCLLMVHAIALSALVGFLFSARPLYGVPWLSSMAVHTAPCVLAVSIAALMGRPEREPVVSLLRQTFSDGAPGWLLIGVTVLPVAVALPAVIAMRRGVVDVGFTMALVVVVLIGLQTCVLWRDSRVLHQAQLRRRKTESELARSERFAVVGRLSASISHELTSSLDVARNLVFLIDGAVSLIEAKSFASLAGSQLAAINQITSQTSKFYEERSGLRDLGLDQDHPDAE